MTLSAPLFKNNNTPLSLPPISNSPSLSQAVRGDGEFRRERDWVTMTQISSSPSPGGGQQGDEALSVSVFGNAGMFSGGDRGDRLGASRGVFHPLSPSFSPFLFLTLAISAYLKKKNTIGFCTLEQSREASDGSRV